MTSVGAVLILLVIVLFAGTVALSLVRVLRPFVIRTRLRSKVVVTLKSGAAFGGVLWEHDRTALVLRGAYAIGAADRGENLPVDGELILYAVDVEYIQKP